MKHILRVLPYLKPYWRLAILCGLLTLGAAALGLLAPWPLKVLVDYVVGSRPMPHALAVVAAWISKDRFTLAVAVVAAGLLIVFLENVFQVLNSYAQTKLEQRMVLDVRSDLFKHALKLPLGYYDGKRSGSLIYALNYQADAAGALLMVLPQIGHSLVILVGMFAISWQIDAKLASLSLVVVPPLVFAVRYYATRVQVRLRRVKDMEGESLSIIHEAVSMMRVIVAFGREGHEFTRFRKQGEEAVGARVRLTVRQTLFSLVVAMTTAAGTALVLGLGASAVLGGQITVGDLLVIMAYIAAIYKPLETISYTVGQLQDTFVNLQIAFELLDTEPEIADAPHAKPLRAALGRVSFEGVSFSYCGRRDTLRGITFDAQPGQIVALVGPTGAGKTTIVSLIPRFYEPQAGRVLLDGRDVKGLTLASLRRHISVVSQEPLLFSGSIAENIRYGRLDASDDAVAQAARRANAHDFITRLPEGYDTKIGERGSQLSGGERQRICIARAFLKNAPILILDEPTSAVDSRTEAGIFEALDRLMLGRTTFMIAHRLSTVRRASKILVIDRGELVEQGTHEQLLAARGLYRQLHDMQMGAEKEKSFTTEDTEITERKEERVGEIYKE